MKEAFDLIRKEVRVLSEQEFCKRRKQEECDKYVDCETCLIDSVIQIVSEVEAEYGNGWIPCESGRMPVLGQTVLACINPSVAEHEIILARYEDYKWWHDGTVIAWMPLPSPFKPEKGD